MAAKAKTEFIATGRRKTSIARVRMWAGTGEVVINDKKLPDYFGHESFQLAITQPFQVTSTAGKYDVSANLVGGGISGQAQALQHGISRALISMNPELRKSLKASGLLTRDPREKERRKVGHRKARKRSQYSKR